MKSLGIDFGERRIGLALSDADGRIALAHGVVLRSSDRQALDEIAALVEAEGVQSLVVGEPRRPADGAATAAALRARRFGDRLSRRTGLPVTYVDESLSSVEAESRLREAGLSPDRRAARRDALAAEIVLQEALDRRAAGERR